MVKGMHLKTNTFSLEPSTYWIRPIIITAAFRGTHNPHRQRETVLGKGCQVNFVTNLSVRKIVPPVQVPLPPQNSQAGPPRFATYLWGVTLSLQGTSKRPIYKLEAKDFLHGSPLPLYCMFTPLLTLRVSRLFGAKHRFPEDFAHSSLLLNEHHLVIQTK